MIDIRNIFTKAAARFATAFVRIQETCEGLKSFFQLNARPRHPGSKKNLQNYRSEKIILLTSCTGPEKRKSSNLARKPLNTALPRPAIGLKHNKAKYLLHRIDKKVHVPLFV